MFAAIVLTSKAGFNLDMAAKVIFSLLVVAIQAVLPTLGHAEVLRALRWLTIPFRCCSWCLAILTAGKANLHSVAHGAGWGELFLFLALVIAAGTRLDGERQRLFPVLRRRARTRSGSWSPSH